MRYWTLTLLLLGLLLGACNSDPAAPSEPTETPETFEEDESAAREVYSMTIGDGLVGQEIDKRGIKKTAALTQQDTENIQLDSETSVLYLNADRADLAALAKNGFLKDALDDFVPVLIEGEVKEQTDALFQEMFDFTLLEYNAAVIASTGGEGNYKVIPIGKTNDVNAVLDTLLEQSSRFRDAAEADGAEDPSFTTASHDTEDVIETQQSDGDWVKGPNYKQRFKGKQKWQTVWQEKNGWVKCPDSGAFSCSGEIAESKTTSHTWGWSTSVGISVADGYGPAATGSVSTEYEQTYSVGKETAGSQPIQNGKWYRPIIEVPYRRLGGDVTGVQLYTPQSEPGPRGETFPGEQQEKKVKGTYYGSYSTGPAVFSFEVSNNRPF